MNCIAFKALFSLKQCSVTCDHWPSNSSNCNGHFNISLWMSCNADQLLKISDFFIHVRIFAQKTSGISMVWVCHHTRSCVLSAQALRWLSVESPFMKYPPEICRVFGQEWNITHLNLFQSDSVYDRVKQGIAEQENVQVVVGLHKDHQKVFYFRFVNMNLYDHGQLEEHIG